MSDAFDQLRPQPAGCPSNLALHRLVAGESDEWAAHVSTCQACAVRVAELRAGWRAIADVDPSRLLAAIERRPPRRRRLLYAAAPLLLAAGLVVVLWPAPEGDQTREKGGAALHVYRQNRGPGEPGGRTDELVSGARLRPGDRLAFAVDLPGPAEVRVLGRQQDGTIYVAWPLGNTEPALTALPAGPRQPLPGGVELDDSRGLETLYLVSCRPGQAAPRCEGDQGGLRCPPGCSVSPFIMDKGP